MKKVAMVFMMIAALLLTMATAFADDVPVINIVIPTMGTHTESSADVEAAINEILVPKIGAKIHLTFTNFGDHPQQINMMMTNPDELDLTWIYGSPRQYVYNGQLLDITKYVDSEDGQAIKDTVGAEFVEATRQTDGRFYYLPTVCDRARETYMQVSSQVMRDLGYETVDDEKVWTMDEIHDLIAEAVSTHEGMYGLCSIDFEFEFDALGDASKVGVVENHGKAEKVISITESQQFIDVAHTMRAWNQEGLIMPDIVSNSENVIGMLTSGKAFATIGGGACPNNMEGEDSWRALLTISNQWVSAESAERMTYVINAMSKHPDEAFKVLKELYTNEEVKELLSFGIKGVNYVLDDQGRATYPDGVNQDSATYNLGFANWFVMPNGQCDIVPFTNSVNYWELSRNYDKTADLGGALGCVFVTDNVQGQYAECTNVYNQYYKAIITGTLDPDTAIPEYSAALKAAGEDDIIAEKQRQLDEYRATKK